MEPAQIQHLPALPALSHLLPVLDALVIVLVLVLCGGHLVYQVLQAARERPLLLVSETVVQRVVDCGSEVGNGETL